LPPPAPDGGGAQRGQRQQDQRQAAARPRAQIERPAGPGDPGDDQPGGDLGRRVGAIRQRRQRHKQQRPGDPPRQHDQPPPGDQRRNLAAIDERVRVEQVAPGAARPLSLPRVGVEMQQRRALRRFLGAPGHHADRLRIGHIAGIGRADGADGHALQKRPRVLRRVGVRLLEDKHNRVIVDAEGFLGLPVLVDPVGQIVERRHLVADAQGAKLRRGLELAHQVIAQPPVEQRLVERQTHRPAPGDARQRVVEAVAGDHQVVCLIERLGHRHDLVFVVFGDHPQLDALHVPAEHIHRRAVIR